MGTSIIQQPFNIITKKIRFIYQNFGYWKIENSIHYRILKAASPNFLILGDGTELCKIYESSNGSLIEKTSEDDFLEIECLVITN